MNEFSYINRILQGDCRNLMRDLDDESISACITDPPYNYEIIGHDWDDVEAKRRISNSSLNGSSTLVKNIPYGGGLSGGIRDKNWYKRNDESIQKYQNWCVSWAVELFRVCKPGAAIVVFSSTRSVAHVQVGLERAGFFARDIMVWRRRSGFPKGLSLQKQLEKQGFADVEKWGGWNTCLRSEWEAICILQKPLIKNYFNTFVEYGTGFFKTRNESGGVQSNILEGFDKASEDCLSTHFTVKPLSLMKRLVEIFVPEDSGSVLLDPFAGTGTTLLAAKECGRSFVGFEIVPNYVQAARVRLGQLEGVVD